MDSRARPASADGAPVDSPNMLLIKDAFRALAGGLAESQLRWTYRFRDGLVEEAHWGPRHEA